MPFRLMTFRLPPAIAVLALIAAPALLRAQEISAAEEQRLEALARENAEIYVPKTNVTVGFRVLGSGAKVNFGHLGNVGFDLTVAPRSEGAVDRLYDNGSVRSDSLRLDERDENGNAKFAPGSRYPLLSTVTVNVTDANGNVTGTEDILVQTGDFLAYTPGLTRNWGYGSASQVTSNGRIAMSTYSATSEGATAMKKEGASAGVEFQYVRTFSPGTRRVQWGLLAGITLNGINSKTAGEVTSTLNTRTDYYSLNGLAAPPLPVTNVTDSSGNVTGTTTGAYLAPAYVDYVDSTGAVLRTNGLETTVPISAVPDGPTTETATPGGVKVKGNWQVKGAYFMVRLGPSFRAQITERFGVNASLGLAGAYAGTVYSVAETFEVPGLTNVLVGTTAGTNGLEQNTAAKFLSGYYADFNMEWAANERTGLFGGVTAQKLGDYDQAVGGRTARIDLGSTVGLRAGISIKF